MLGSLSSLRLARLRVGRALAFSFNRKYVGGTSFASASYRTCTPQLHLAPPFLQPNPYPAKNYNRVRRLVLTHCARKAALEQGSSPLAPGLYLVGTPIGNLEDLSVRALKVLQTATTILAEDTRHSRKLLNHYNIDAHLYSFHQHNENSKQDRVSAAAGLLSSFAPLQA